MIRIRQINVKFNKQSYYNCVKKSFQNLKLLFKKGYKFREFDVSFIGNYTKDADWNYKMLNILIYTQDSTVSSNND